MPPKTFPPDKYIDLIEKNEAELIEIHDNVTAGASGLHAKYAFQHFIRNELDRRATQAIQENMLRLTYAMAFLTLVITGLTVVNVLLVYSSLD